MNHRLYYVMVTMPHQLHPLMALVEYWSFHDKLSLTGNENIFLFLLK